MDLSLDQGMMSNQLKILLLDFTAAGVLETYRGYRLQIESLLRTQINPRYSQLQIQLAVAKYQYEQKTIEWIDQQIVMLESVLRENGGLQNMTLDTEMAMLRVGSNAAMVAVAAEASSRVTVDDVLEVDASEETGGLLPEYSENNVESNFRIIAARMTGDNEATPSSGSGSSGNNNATLPAYSSQSSDDQPPAYSIWLYFKSFLQIKNAHIACNCFCFIVMIIYHLFIVAISIKVDKEINGHSIVAAL